MSEDRASPSWLARPLAVHDFITRLGFVVAGVCLVLIVFTYCYEIVARYFFVAPTTWASSTVSYLLCYMVFLAMPELTRQRVHIFINIVLDMMPNRRATLLQRGAYVVATIACLLAAGFSLEASWSQYVGGYSTVNEWRVPKWLVSGAIPYGLFSTSLYFLRHALSGSPYKSAEVV